jgi:hypothetical protein
MKEYPSDPQSERSTPTLREMLAGYALFNAWEEEEQSIVLPHLTVEESLRQYFDLCNLASVLSDDDDPVFLEQNAKHWAQLRERLERLQGVTPHGQTTTSAR